MVRDLHDGQRNALLKARWRVCDEASKVEKKSNLRTGSIVDRVGRFGRLRFGALRN
jgi:hypothetical protein